MSQARTNTEDLINEQLIMMVFSVLSRPVGSEGNNVPKIEFSRLLAVHEGSFLLAEMQLSWYFG